MCPQRWYGIEPKEFVKVFIETAVKSVVFTCLWIPVYLMRCVLVYFVQKSKPSYGKILDYMDCTVEENYNDGPPKNTIAFTMVLDGSLEVKELRRLFIQNVLGATVKNKKTGEDQLRFREYRQYQVDFAGYKFWRDDQTFNVDNHVVEEEYSERYSSLRRIHQEAINKPYPKKRSPWEIILVPRYRNEEGKTLLVYRSHHSMGDTKSCLKVLIEALGEKQLTLPEAQYPKEGILHIIKYYALFPFFYVYVQVLCHYAGLKSDDSIFKFKKEKEPLLYLGLSENISVNDIKLIAKRHGVNTSAVIMTAITLGIAKSDQSHRQKDIPCQWVLPKPNHPVKLANYSYSAIMDLPTTLTLPKECLERCDEIFRQLKRSKLYVYDKAVCFQNGTWFTPLRQKFLYPSTFPLILSNIAGDREGFKIGGNTVLEHSMTCGPMPGSTGVLIIPFSYKDVIQISATVKAGILTESQTQKLAELVAGEFQNLKNL